jgi:hypothetical protein
VTAFAGLHNTNLVFVKTKGRDTGFATRKHLRDVERLAKELKKQGQKVFKENLANIRLEKQLKREQKKNVKHNRTTKNTI